VSDAPKKILFVCTGNICRSAMAEHLLRRWSEQNIDLEQPTAVPREIRWSVHRKNAV